WLRTSRIEWHGVRLGAPDWGPESRTLAVTIQGVDSRRKLQLILNAHSEALTFDVPEPEGPIWKLIVDTARPSPDDIRAWKDAAPFRGRTCTAQPRSVIVLISAAEIRGGSSGTASAP